MMISDMNAVIQRINSIKNRFGLRHSHQNALKEPSKKFNTELQKKITDSSHNLSRNTTNVTQSIGRSDINRLADHYAAQNGIPSSLLKAVIQTESGYKSRAVSRKGAKGLMQLMPSVLSQSGVADPFSPSENIRAGAGLLKTLLKDYNWDYKKALAAYNAGKNAVDNNDALHRYKETSEYVQKVINSYLQNSE